MAGSAVNGIMYVVAQAVVGATAGLQDVLFQEYLSSTPRKELRPVARALLTIVFGLGKAIGQIYGGTVNVWKGW